MKKHLALISLAFTIVAVLFASCKKYDDSAIKQQLADHERRIAALETAVTFINNQVGSMQGVLNTLQSGDWITSVTPLEDGYIINFSKRGPVTIKNGQDGAKGEKGDKGDDGEKGDKGDDGEKGDQGDKGEDGETGAAGKDGLTPIIGVDIFEDVYYWTITIDGVTDWLKDNDDNKIPTTGPKGATGSPGDTGAEGPQGPAGATPVFGIDADGYWTIMWPGDTEPSFLLDANKKKVLARTEELPFGVTVDVDNNELVFAFKNGNTIRIPIHGSKYKITVAEAVGANLYVAVDAVAQEFNVEIAGLSGSSDLAQFYAELSGSRGYSGSAYNTRAVPTPWVVKVAGAPTYNEDGAAAKIRITAPNGVDFSDDSDEPYARLVLSVLGTDGSVSTATYAVTIGEAPLPPLTVPDVDALDGITGGGDLPTGTITYVGAFWRASETGERVIKINVGADAGNLGDWSAEVAWYDGRWNPSAGDGVVLSAEESGDANLYTTNPDNAENHRVDGQASSVSGTLDLGGNIVFRIGLTKQFSNDTAFASNPAWPYTTKFPARYAVVKLTYNDGAKTQLIYLRQGEDPDYLMRPGDTDGSGGGVADSRSNAKKWSPYNLTSPGRNPAAAGTTVAIGGGVFVEYPTQAGAYFQWANEAIGKSRLAYSVTGAATGWQNRYPYTFWSALRASHETSPANYTLSDGSAQVTFRRPSDGSISAANAAGAVADSETRQSLWLNPQAATGSNTDNSVWGYYADGFFDRRAIVDANDSQSTVVSPSGADIAYVGRLMFNPANRASLFFPAAGSRSFDTSAVNSTGTSGYYWTGSSSTTETSWTMRLYNAGANPQPYYRSDGFSIRSVVE